MSAANGPKYEQYDGIRVFRKYYYLDSKTQFGQVVGKGWLYVKEMKETVSGNGGSWITTEKLVRLPYMPDYYFAEQAQYFMDGHLLVFCENNVWSVWYMWKKLRQDEKLFAAANAQQYAIEVKGEQERDVKQFQNLLANRENFVQGLGIRLATRPNSGWLLATKDEANGKWSETKQVVYSDGDTCSATDQDHRSRPPPPSTPAPVLSPDHPLRKEKLRAEAPEFQWKYSPTTIPEEPTGVEQEWGLPEDQWGDSADLDDDSCLAHRACTNTVLAPVSDSAWRIADIEMQFFAPVSASACEAAQEWLDAQGVPEESEVEVDRQAVLADDSLSETASETVDPARLLIDSTESCEVVDTGDDWESDASDTSEDDPIIAIGGPSDEPNESSDSPASPSCAGVNLAALTSPAPSPSPAPTSPAPAEEPVLTGYAGPRNDTWYEQQQQTNGCYTTDIGPSGAGVRAPPPPPRKDVSPSSRLPTPLTLLHHSCNQMAWAQYDLAASQPVYPQWPTQNVYPKGSYGQGPVWRPPPHVVG